VCGLEFLIEREQQKNNGTQVVDWENGLVKSHRCLENFLFFLLGQIC
jgi:hypothetical protein